MTFKQWLKANDNRLRSYTSDEIAFLGFICGFPLEIICPEVCDHVSRIKRMMNFWESPLSEKWLRLCIYNNGKDE